MSHYFNNNLLNGYQNYKKNNVPFQNNNLLRNNPMFQNSMNQNNSNQMRMMQQMQEQMGTLRKLQQLKQNERLNDLDNIIDKDTLVKTIIRPLKEPKIDKIELNNMALSKQNALISEKENYWRARTNQPYKNILKNENYSIFFQKKGRDLNETELIVHKVTDADKLEERLLSEFNELNNMIEKHDDELKAIYSLSEKMKHKKKFDYVHVNKYEKITYDPIDFNDMKKDKIELYKKEQEQIDKGKKKIDDIIENLVNKGILTEEEIIKHDNENNLDSNELEELERELDNITEDDLKLLEEEKEQEKEKEKEQENNKIKNDKPKAKLIKKTDNSTISNDKQTISNDKQTISNDKQTILNDKPKAKLIKKSDITETENKINASISDDIKNKYLQRQSKN